MDMMWYRRRGLMVTPHIERVTGAIASFNSDYNKIPVKSLICDIEPIQNLHGYDHPWPAGGGKNLLFAGAKNQTRLGLTFTAIGDGSSFTVTGTTTGNTAITLDTGAKAPEKLLNGKTYTLSGGHWPNTQVAYVQLVYKGNTTGNTISIVSVNGPNTITLTEDATLDSIYINFVAGNTFTNDLIQPQFEIGSTATAFSPYSNICPISGRTGLSVARTANAQQWDEEWEVGAISVSDGSLLNMGSYMRSKNYIPVAPGKTYYRAGSYLSDGRAFFYGYDKTFVSHIPIGSVGTFNIPHNAVYMKIHKNGAYYDNNIGVNYPATATAYTPYSGDTYTIQLGQTVYGGTLDAVSGKLVVDRAMYVFTGNESQYLAASDGRIAVNINHYTKIGPAVCSDFSGVVTANNLRYIYISTSMTADELKSYMGEHTVQCVYLTAESITISLTPQEIRTLLGENNIWCDSGDVSVDYWKWGK